MLAIPIALGIYLTRRMRLGWRLWWIGGATFILSQVGHLPFNALLNVLFRRSVLPMPPVGWQPVVFSLIGGLSAALWEEPARCAVYRWWAKDARSWGRALLLGAGHGGMEAILLGGLVLLTFLQMLALKDADLNRILPPERVREVEYQVRQYWSLPWTMTLLGAYERLQAIPLHLANAVLVLQVFTRRQSRWLLAAIVWHALVNTAAALAVQAWGAYVTEGLMTIEAVISLAILWSLRQPEPPPGEEDSPLLPQGLQPGLRNDSLSQEELEASKYC